VNCWAVPYEDLPTKTSTCSEPYGTGWGGGQWSWMSLHQVYPSLPGPFPSLVTATSLHKVFPNV